MRFFLTLLLYYLLTTNLYSQKNNIRFITLSHSNSSLIGSKVNIFIFQEEINKNSFYVSVKTYESEKKLSVDYKKIQELKEAIFKLSPEDFIKESRNCLDGSDTEIIFTNNIFGNNEVKFSVNCLDSEDSKTSWKDFLNVVNLILDMAKMKFTDLK